MVCFLLPAALTPLYQPLAEYIHGKIEVMLEDDRLSSFQLSQTYDKPVTQNAINASGPRDSGKASASGEGEENEEGGDTASAQWNSSKAAKKRKRAETTGRSVVNNNA